MKPSCLAVLWIIGLILLPSPSPAQSADEWYRKGFEQSLEGRTQSAIQSYRNALEARPDWAEARHALGTLLYRTRQGPEAVAQLRLAERYYAARKDAQAAANLKIVRRSLRQAYRELGLDPKDFEQIESFPGAVNQAQWQASGSGFFAGVPGRVLTAYHAVKDSSKIRVRLADQSTHPARLVRSFIIYDVAVLEVEVSGQRSFSSLRLGDSSLMKEGGPVWALSGPSQEGTATAPRQGKILAVNALESNKTLVHLGLSAGPLESGGPLFNPRGEVIGMLFTRKDIRGLFRRMKPVPADTSFAVKSSYLQAVLDRTTGSGKTQEAVPKASESSRFDAEALRAGRVIIEVSP